MSFVEEAVKLSKGLVEKLINHPFNVELAKGNLPKEKFKYYIEQDSLYITLYTKALEILHQKAEAAETKTILNELVTDAMEIERGLHDIYFTQLKISEPIPIKPLTDAYGNFLVSTASIKTFAEGLAALLPCFISYGEVGKHIFNNSVNDNPYKDWINTYSDDSYDHYIQKLIKITNSAAELSHKKTYQNMLALYLRSNKYEFMFWDAAYKMEDWVL